MGKKGVFFILDIMVMVSLACPIIYAADKGAEAKVIAIVNGTKITSEHVKEKLSRGDEKGEILEKIIRGELLYQEALRRGLDKKPNASKKKRELVHALMKDEEARLKIPAKEIDDYIAKNFAQAYGVAKIRLSSILVSKESIAQYILKMLSSGEDFGHLVQAYSEDKKTRSKSGNLGFVSREELLPEVAEPVFQLKRPGEVTDIIRTPQGYQIFKLTDRSEIERFERAARKALTGKFMAERITELMRHLRAKAHIVILDNTLN